MILTWRFHVNEVKMHVISSNSRARWKKTCQWKSWVL